MTLRFSVLQTQYFNSHLIPIIPNLKLWFNGFFPTEFFLEMLSLFSLLVLSLSSFKLSDNVGIYPRGGQECARLAPYAQKAQVPTGDQAP